MVLYVMKVLMKFIVNQIKQIISKSCFNFCTLQVTRNNTLYTRLFEEYKIILIKISLTDPLITK